MPRYVDVDKYLSDEFCDNFDDCSSLEDCFICWARKATEDVVPVVHAKWEWSYHNDESECSNCGHWSVAETNYCPNCGAKMDN